MKYRKGGDHPQKQLQFSRLYRKRKEKIMNNIITIQEMSIATRKFKNNELQEATIRIASIYQDAAKFAETKNREIASILANIMDKEAYKDDGFKSVGDYAHEVFGLNKQNAYALAAAGKIYNDENASEVLKSMTPHKLAEVSRVGREELDKAIEDGTISPETSQKDLRAFAAAVKYKDAPAKVVPQFTAHPCQAFISEQDADNSSLPKTTDEWNNSFTDRLPDIPPSLPVEATKLPKVTSSASNGKEIKYARRLYVSDMFSLVVEYHPYAAPKGPKKVAGPKYTKEALLKMLAELEESEQ